MRRTLVPILAAFLTQPGPPSHGAERPNVVVILADDLGYADIGVHGLETIPTPHIDSLARDGVRCTDGYVSGTVCSPTRAGLLTGRYQQRFGHEFNPHKGDPDALGLPVEEVTIADRVKALGYATGVFGKWHLGVTERFHPSRRGFDEFYGFVGGARSYFPTPVPGAGARPDVTALTFRAPIESGGRPVEWDGYLTERLAGEAADFVRRHRDGPFLLYLSFNAVHTPMEATEKYLARVGGVDDPRRRTYLAMAAALDDAVGVVLKALADSGLDERTLVFFLSDNGGPTEAFAVNGSANAPLRGGKGDTWEGGIRVPFLVRWTGRLPAGKVYREPVIQLDILPTALAAAGGTIDPAWDLDGVDLLPYLAGSAEGRPHDTLYWRMGPDNWAVRHGDRKVVRTFRSGEPKLFDLASDVGERRDRRADEPEVYADLRARWEEWDRRMAEPLWVDPNPDPYGDRKGDRN